MKARARSCRSFAKKPDLHLQPQARAAKEQDAAAAAARRVARELVSSLSVRDAGEVLGLSHQRVQQLVGD